LNFVTHAGFGKWRRGLALAGLLLLLVFAAGCEDDDTLGLGVTCITFVPDAVPTAGEVVARRAAESDCDVVVVELIVTGVENVYATNFDIDYPQQFALISQNLVVSDSFLGTDLIQNLDEVPPGSGMVVGGLTRQGDVTIGVTPDDTNNILFKVGFVGFTISGSEALTFNDANLIIAGIPPTGSIPAIPFRGGTLMIIDHIP